MPSLRHLASPNYPKRLVACVSANVGPPQTSTEVVLVSSFVG